MSVMRADRREAKHGARRTRATDEGEAGGAYWGPPPPPPVTCGGACPVVRTSQQVLGESNDTTQVQARTTLCG